MDNIYDKIRKRARQIVSKFPTPDFYQNFSQVNEISRRFYETDSLVAKIKLGVSGKVKNNFGHGLEHATKVSIDAGSLMIIEGRLAGYSDDFVTRRVFLAQIAGLFHDIERKHKDHAEKGAVSARKALKAYSSFTAQEVEDISKAIQNHEAFKKTVEISSPEGGLISDCLYDADKFRWGPDNFTHTVWDMVSFANLPLYKFVELYPNGMKGLSKIKGTFRTQTGKKYGPQFIDTGIAIGKELNHVIKTDFAQYLKASQKEC